jgi:WD40 repeat protein
MTCSRTPAFLAALFILLTLSLAACSQQGLVVPATLTPADSSTPPADQIASTSTIPPTLAATATAPLATLPPTPSVQVVDAENAAALSIRYRLGKGTIWAPPVYSPDGSFLVVSSTTGAHFYDAQTLEEISSFPTQGWAELVAFSPDGSLLVAGSRFRISLYDLPSGAVIRDLAFSPDGRLLAAGYGDGLYRVWSVASGELLHTGSGSQLVFSPDGSLLAGVEYGFYNPGKVYLYEAATGLLLREWDEQRATFTPDGLLVVEADGAVRVIDPATWSTPHAFSGSQAAFSADGKSLALAYQDTVQLMDYASGSRLQVLEGTYGIIQDLQFSPDGKTLAGSINLFECCVSSPDTTMLWNIEDGKIITSTMQFFLQAGAFSPDGGAYMTAGRYGVDVLDPSTGVLLGRLDDYASAAAGIAFSPDGESIAAAFGDPVFSARIWQTSTGQPVKRLLDEGFNSGSYSYLDLAFSPDETIMALRGDLWQFSTGKQLQELQRIMSEDHSFWASSIAFQPQANILATGSFDGYLALWDIDTNTVQGRLPGAAGEVISLDYSADGSLLAAVTGYPEYKVHVWAMPAAQLVLSLDGDSENYVGVALAPDGQTFATMSRFDDIMKGSYVRIWRTSDGVMLLQTDIANVTSMAFSPDGELLALGNETGILRLVQVQDGSLIAALPGHTGLISGVAFSPDGILLATSSGDGTVFVWGLHP